MTGKDVLVFVCRFQLPAKSSGLLAVPKSAQKDARPGQEYQVTVCGLDGKPILETRALCRQSKAFKGVPYFPVRKAFVAKLVNRQQYIVRASPLVGSQRGVRRS